VRIPLLLGFAGLVTGASRNAPPTREVEVIAGDYAFELPRELPAGRTAFRVRNTGKVSHQFHLLLLKPGSTIEQYVQLRRESKSAAALVEGPVGILFVLPGKVTSSSLSTDLLAGRDYAVDCELRDSATAPRHLEMGMYSLIHVKASKASKALPAVRADTIVGMDYAFRYPQTVSPGRHTIVFRNDGKLRHEVTIALLAKGVTLERFLEVRKARGDVRSLTEEPNGLLYAGAGQEPLGRLEVNLLPGREYRLICTLTDNEKSPRHFELGMYGLIRVTGQASNPP
jgi:hypothetical protein